MIKTHAVVPALALATTAATAQTVSVNLTHDDVDGIIAIGETVTWSLSIGHSGFDPGWVVGLGNMTVTGDNTLGTSTDFVYEYFNGGTFLGTSNGAGIDDIRFGNAPFCIDPLCDPHNTDNPMLIGTFDFTATQAGLLDYDLSEGTANWGFVEMQLDIVTRDAFDVFSTAILSNSLLIVPSPGSLAMIAGAGLLAARRRPAR